MPFYITFNRENKSNVFELLAKELALATEAPDTDIHGPMDFELDQTWIYPGDQQGIHSLTGGFHGVDELMTAFKFLYTPRTDIQTLGELLHRYGDTYAHTRLDNLTPSMLKEYEFANDDEKLQFYIDKWKEQKGPDINYRIAPWIEFLNHNVKKYGYQFLTNTVMQKNALRGRTLVSYLHYVYINQPKDKFVMYGNSIVTDEHASLDGGMPDYIYVRPGWYMTYVQNLSTLLSYKYSLNNSKLNKAIFDRMLDFATANRCKLKGIIDFEIALIKREKEFYVPVFYSQPHRVFASIDAVFNRVVGV